MVKAEDGNRLKFWRGKLMVMANIRHAREEAKESTAETIKEKNTEEEMTAQTGSDEAQEEVINNIQRFTAQLVVLNPYCWHSMRRKREKAWDKDRDRAIQHSPEWHGISHKIPPSPSSPITRTATNSCDCCWCLHRCSTMLSLSWPKLL